MASPIIIDTFTWAAGNGSPIVIDNSTDHTVINIDTTTNKTEQVRSAGFIAPRKHIIIKGHFEGTNNTIGSSSNDTQVFYVGLVKETFPGSGVFSNIITSGGEVNTINALNGDFSFNLNNVEPGEGYRVFIGEIGPGDAESLIISDITLTFICFADSAMIRTIDGYRKVDTLKAGDLVWTLDNGYKPIRWVGSRQLDEEVLRQNPKLVPVAIKPHSKKYEAQFGELLVSQQHRMLVSEPMNKRSADGDQLLVSAKKLLEFNNFRLADEVKGVTYYHVMLDEHEILDANGIMTESFYPGDQALSAIAPEQLEEIYSIFPDLEINSFAFSRDVPNNSNLVGFFKAHYINRNHVHLHYADN